MNRYPNNCTVIRTNIDNDNNFQNLIETLVEGFYGYGLELHNSVPGCAAWEVDQYRKNGCNEFTYFVVDYDERCAAECGITQDTVFCELLKDMESLAAKDELWTAKFYALKNGGKYTHGIENAHTLVIELPLNMPGRDWRAARAVTEDIAGSHLHEIRTKSINRKKLAEQFK